MERVGVTVFCLAYNHERYIRKTLDGFVSQKTTFPVEYIIHDDASTDNTVAIIKEYEKKYPDIIKPIFQKENQYKKNGGIIKTFIWPKVRGKYLACCEGDDFWTDQYKLQKQYDVMEDHPECSICVHRVVGMSEDEKEVVREFPDFDIKEGIVRAEDVIDLMLAKGKWLFHTSSYFRRVSDAEDAFKGKYEFVNKPYYGDFAALLYSAIKGDFYYLCNPMSVYRMNSLGSMVVAERISPEKRLDSTMRYERAILAFDKESNYRFHDAVSIAYKRNEFDRLRYEKKFREMLKSEYRKYLLEKPFYVKIQVIGSAIFPFVDKIYSLLRKIIRGY